MVNQSVANYSTMNKIKTVNTKMNIMRYLRIVFYLMLSSVFYACEQVPKYPRYEIGMVKYIPDSLKTEHREFIIKATKSASFHMSGGDYEDPKETLWAAQNMADELFEVKEYGLIRELDSYSWNDSHIPMSKMSDFEKTIFDSLNNAR